MSSATVEAPKVGTVDLLALLTADRKLPKGCTHWALKSVRPDGLTSHGFVWPLTKKVVKAAGPMRAHKYACPQADGDGLCLATSWQGMSSGGISAITLLLIAYNAANVHGTDTSAGKMRVSECVVVEVVDGQRLLMEKGLGANLGGADLRGANLRYANLRGANLRGANLRGADLRYANLGGANLRGADLRGADLRYADLGGANLRGANLGGADLGGAYLDGANLDGANLGGADLRGANLDGANLGGAFVYTTTTLPVGFDAQRAGIVVFP